MKYKHAITVALVALFLVAASSGMFSGQNTEYKKPQSVKTENFECVVKTEDRTVRGDSLTGLLESGLIVRVFIGYYNCNEINREDVIIYDFSGNSNPVIKIVKGLPGDRFHLQEAEAGWNILINDEIAKNSQNQSYILNKQGYRMLSLYENDYKGVIPQDTYLILGNLAFGSLDSSHFGLISKKDIVGKVKTDQLMQ